MAVMYDPKEDRTFVCPQAGQGAMNYAGPCGEEANWTVPSCYGGDCTTMGAHGPLVHCNVRERLRDFYANGVQGGTPKCTSQRTDAQSASGLPPPFSTYAINYFGDLDPYRERPYDVANKAIGVAVGAGNSCASDYEAFGHYMQNTCGTNSCSMNAPVGVQVSTYQQPLFILPVPGMKAVKTIDSMAFPGATNVCTKFL